MNTDVIDTLFSDEITSQIELGGDYCSDIC